MRTRPISVLACSSALAHAVPRCTLSGSAICRPTLSAGLSDDMGSWKIMAILLPRTARMPASSSLKRLRPSNTTSPLSMRPGGDGMRRMIDSAVTLLPEPDSPTSATVSPASMSKETLSTAVTLPRSLAKRVVRLRTCRRGRGIENHRAGRRLARPSPTPRLPASVTHLLLKVLVDPNARVDGAGADSPGAQLAVVVFHPRPPRRVKVWRGQPNVGRLVDDLARHLLEHGLTLRFVALGIDVVHLLIERRIGPTRRVPLLPGGEALADGRCRVGMAVGHEVPRCHLARGHCRQECRIFHGLNLDLYADLLQIGGHQRQQVHVVGTAGAHLHLEAEAIAQSGLGQQLLCAVGIVLIELLYARRHGLERLVVALVIGVHGIGEELGVAVVVGGNDLLLVDRHVERSAHADIIERLLIDLECQESPGHVEPARPLQTWRAPLELVHVLPAHALEDIELGRAQRRDEGGFVLD